MQPTLLLLLCLLSYYYYYYHTDRESDADTLEVGTLVAVLVPINSTQLLVLICGASLVLSLLL